MLDFVERISELLFKFIRDEISQEELKELEFWINSSDENRRTFIRATRPASIIEGLRTSEKKETIKEMLVAEPLTTTPTLFFRSIIFKLISIAAVVILIVVLGWLIFSDRSTKQIAVKVETEFKADVGPGSNKAILTLANGSTLVLDSLASGAIAEQGNAKILKLIGGQIAYSHDPKINVNGVLYNTVTTPKGGQYQVALPDGTHVWINAASSLRFPTSFTGKERSVELMGEGYFEVVKNSKMPFVVSINGMQVEVLGTHFNIMGYEDEKQIKTTLLEGAVRIMKGNSDKVLKPGEQAALDVAGNISVQKDVDLEEVVAWKNGEFQFNGASIETIMKQVSRWYDVDVVYEGKIPHAFVASISRNVPVSKLLKLLRLTGQVDFTIEDRKIIVKPQQKNQK